MYVQVFGGDTAVSVGDVGMDDKGNGGKRKKIIGRTLSKADYNVDGERRKEIGRERTEEQVVGFPLHQAASMITGREHLPIWARPAGEEGAAGATCAMYNLLTGKRANARYALSERGEKAQRKGRDEGVKKGKRVRKEQR